MNKQSRAVLLHGTSGNTTQHWFPWIKKELEQSGYEVYAPTLPNNDAPNMNTYDAFLRDSGWDFTDNILIGHSSGATTILNLLSSEWFPHVKAVVLVGVFLNEKLTKSVEWYVPGQFDNLFLPEYDPQVLKAKADKFYFVHSDNDPYCDINDAKMLSDEVDGVFITIHRGHHLGGSSGRVELIELSDALHKDGLLV
jgi:hypothetical protein